MRLLLTPAAALSAFVFAGSAMAASYSGHWPFAVTDSRGFNGSHCLALTDNGGFGWPHSGSGTLDGSNFATFQVIGNAIEVVVQDQGVGQAAGTVITAKAKKGILGKGIFATVLTGESVDSGKVAFGANGGC